MKIDYSFFRLRKIKQVTVFFGDTVYTTRDGKEPKILGSGSVRFGFFIDGHLLPINYYCKYRLTD